MRGQPWKPSEEQTLRDLYTSIGAVGCRKLIPHSAQAIRAKACYMGLSYLGKHVKQQPALPFKCLVRKRGGPIQDLTRYAKQRNYNCKNYNTCFNFAADNGWPAFVCDLTKKGEK